jgi:AAA15 family ATPase/GTPase
MTKHLDSLKIQNFRMLEDFEVEKLGQVNLIVGKNNSGKSTVLEALRIYAGNADRHLLEEIAKSHDELYFLKDEDIQPFTTGVARPFFNFFSKKSSAPAYKFSISETTNNQYLSFQYMHYVDFTKVDGLAYKAFFDEGLNEFYRVNKGQYERMENIRAKKLPMITGSLTNTPCGFVSVTTPEMKQLAHFWDDVLVAQQEDTVHDVLKLVHDGFKSLIFIENPHNPNGGRVPYMSVVGQERRTPLKSQGYGLQRLLQIALNIYQAKDGFLLIDEFENGLHYSVQEKVWGLIFEMAKRLNIQVFATTHSWDCIEAFSEVASKREDVEGLLFSMGRSAKTSDNGKIIATIFDEAKLQRFTQADMDVR